MLTKKFSWSLIEHAEDLRQYLARFKPEDDVVEDTESTSLKWSATLLGISIYQKGIEPAFIASKTPYFQGRGIPLNEVVSIMDEFHERHRNIIMHNGKYDLGVFDANGFKMPNLVRDTMQCIHLYDADLIKNLETRVKQDLGYEKKTFKQAVIAYNPDAAKKVKWTTGGKWPAVWTSEMWKYFSLELLGEYAAEDAYWTKGIDELYAPRVIENKVQHIHDKIELPLCHLLKDMKKVGVRIDVEYLESLAIPCRNALAQLEKDIHKEAKCIFNLSSPKQMAEVLYDRMGYQCKYKTDTGARSTDKTALLDMMVNQSSKIAELLIERSALNKLYTGYIYAIPKMVDADGRLRCDFNSEGARTGRFSSSNPNLQNQPNNKRFPVRAAFIPAPGYKFVILDWSQIELRIAAHLSGDSKLCAAFLAGRDIHQEVATQLSIPRDPEAKQVNFGILYGLGPQSLGFQIKRTMEYARNMLNNYRATYRELQDWIENVQSRGNFKGFVKTMFGRVRPLRGFKSKDKAIFASAQRQAVNTVIQGSAADLMKIGLLRIYNYILKNDLDARILLSVHDEVLIECRDEIANDVFWAAKELMETITPMNVPIIAEGKICDNWAQGKDKSFIGYQWDKETGVPVVMPPTKEITKKEAMPYWFRQILNSLIK